MENMLPNNFTNLLLALQYRKTYHRALTLAKQKFNLKQTNIEDLTPFKTLQMYRTVVKKFYMNRTQITEGSWFQNQLRIFLWLLIGYLFIHKKSIQQMQQQDWSYFSSIFHHRPPVSFEYQSLSLLHNSRSPKWTANEMNMLETIIQQKRFRNKWNTIARQLFIRSDKEFYRTPKQCRQRWLNYLDPNKKKTGWEKSEDLTLLKAILHYGNRWSTVVKILKDTRTEHMVKNRYKSMIANEMKNSKQTENEIVVKLIQELQKQLIDKSEFLSLGPKLNTKVSYHQSSNQYHSSKQDILSKTNLNYLKNSLNSTSMMKMKNQPNFYVPPPQGYSPSMMAYNSPVEHPFNSQISNKVSFFGSDSHLSDQNQFLISHEEIDNFILFDPKQKENLMKDEGMQDKESQHHENNNYMQKQQKINYFQEDFQQCFP